MARYVGVHPSTLTLRSASLAALLLASAASCAAHRPERAGSPASQSHWRRRDGTQWIGGLLLGQRSFDDTDWGPRQEGDGDRDDLGDQGLFGFEIATLPHGGGLGFEFSVASSFAKQALEGEVRERDESVSQSALYALGARWTIEGDDRHWYPFIGLGGGVLVTKDSTPHARLGDRDEAFGGYAHAGVLYRIGETFSIGLDYRLFRGDEYEDLERDSDFEQLSLVLAWIH